MMGEKTFWILKKYMLYILVLVKPLPLKPGKTYRDEIVEGWVPDWLEDCRVLRLAKTEKKIQKFS